MKLLKRLTVATFCLVASLLYQAAEAQLCTGSLGDPVVNINFGTGSNPGPQLPGQVTNYTYSSGCPQDGRYSILNSITCNAWHKLSEDHTPGDVNGYMMVVNASNDPGVFYVDTVKQQLCENTTYEFAAWMMNFNTSGECGGNSINPNITFTIETLTGVVLQTYETGNIPVTAGSEWKQYGFYFSTPGITSVVIRMVNNAPGGCGNDIALDDITFRPCGPKVTSAIDNGSFEQDVCEGDQTTFILNGSVAGEDANTARQWQISKDTGVTWTDIPNATLPKYTRLATGKGIYKYRMTAAASLNMSTASCRTASNLITINVNANPVPAASNNGPLCEDDALVLVAIDGSTYSWTGPANFSSSLQSPVLDDITTARAGTYSVMVTSGKGCKGYDETTVIVNINPVAYAGKDADICAKGSTVLQGTGDGTYKWLPAATLSSSSTAITTATPKDTTIYSLVVKNAAGCTDTAKITVNVLPLPFADAGPDLKIFEGQSIKLNAKQGPGNTHFYWTPNEDISSIASLDPIVAPLKNITYTLHVESDLGCGTSTDNVFIRVYNKVKIPNSFSPNGDGINDLWQIGALITYTDCDLQLFSRNGKRVFSSHGYYTPWNGKMNGKDLPADTYYYMIDLKNGTPPLSGWLFLVR